MTAAIVIRGRFARGAFIPDEPLPDAEGTAELIITPRPAAHGRRSIFDLFGAADQLRSGADIAAQLREERRSWGAE